MASTRDFHIVDVFSRTPFKGNPLAVVENAQDDLSDAQLQLITRQFNLSETTFFSNPVVANATYKLRSFLPDGTEVFGVGHNILGAWWHLAHTGHLDLTAPASTDDAAGTETFLFHQELGRAVMPVIITRKRQQPGSEVGGRTSSNNQPDDAELTVSIRQARPRLHGIHPDPAGLAASIGLGPEDVGVDGFFGGGGGGNPPLVQLPPQVVSTASTHHLVVPISSVDALHRAVIDRERLREQVKRVHEAAHGMYLFTPTTTATDAATAVGDVARIEARFFSVGMSTEDPATGSAAGPLSAYLVQHGYLTLEPGARAEVRVRQGLQIGRECVIQVFLSRDPASNEVDVEVVATGVQVAAGKIVVPSGDIEF